MHTRSRRLTLWLTAALALPARADEPFPLDGYRLAGCRAEAVDGGLQVEFGNRDDWPNISWKAPETGWDWSGYAALVLTLTNPGESNVAWHIKLNDVGQDGERGATQLSGNVAAGQTSRYYVSLESRSARRASGMRALPPIIGDFGQHLGGGVEPNHITAFQIFRAMPKEPATLILRSIMLAGEASQTDLTGLLDRYGQYTRADWPGKIRSDADLKAIAEAEARDLTAAPALPDRSPYGGWTGGPRQQATGFFRTAQIDGRWWLVDPDGYLFLSMGVDVVRPDATTNLRGRESMFTWLPDDDDPLARFYGGEPGQRRTYDFLKANLDRKYGAAGESEFDARAVARLRAWGFNTLGNWTPERIGRERKFPYVVAISVRGSFATVPGHREGRMPDPFDPAFAAAVDEAVKDKAALAKDDPYCLGYFIDNELPWGMPSIDAEHYVLCGEVFSMSEGSPAKQMFIALLKARYASIADFNAAWKLDLGDWSELNAAQRRSPVPKTEQQRRDFSDFLSRYAERYFEVVASVLKQHDANHLYLGCRFAYWFTPEAVAAAGQHADVISFNIYNWNPNTYRFAQDYGKPCLVGEFHFGATDRGMFTGNVTVANQQARADRYREYVQSVLSEPGFVGCHWFQFYDQPTTGRSQDGENFNIGFASITDTPYRELIDGAQAANAAVYEWHREAD